MILRLVRASVRQRSGRSALLLGGYALGVGVTIVLLSVGQAMVDQARDRELLGGGDLIVLPEGIDLETLRTGGASSMYFSVEQATLIYREVLAGTRFDDRMAAAAPWIDDELLYLDTDSGLVPISAGATLPGAAVDLGAAPDLLAGAWGDLDADRTWRAPSTADFYRSIDGLHLPRGPAAQDTTWAEWHYFNVMLPDSGWLYLTYMVGGDAPDGRWGGRVLATRVAPESGRAMVYSVEVGSASVAFDEGHPDLVIGQSSVTIEADGSYRLRARVPLESRPTASSALAPLTVDLIVSERTRRYLPPVDIGSSDFVSGYTVPLLDGLATGQVCEGARCQRLDGARSYHDHNWGTWSSVTWDWGQARAGPYSVLYGGIARETDGDANATQGGQFLYLADEHGFAGVFTIRELITLWPGREGQGTPAAIAIHADNGPDSLALSVTVGHTQVTLGPVAQDGPPALFYQMRGTLELSGRLFGTEIQESGDGFFETWTRGR
ncbi:MAG: hypothetical protein OXK77_16630 [Gemmatimonadota bacterium]|nr:hypothetical protein [Gemmatimonadota bacterium]MDE2864372.1 hypothetical protein [Gemmatimonadota bacterium]